MEETIVDLKLFSMKRTYSHLWGVSMDLAVVLLIITTLLATSDKFGGFIGGVFVDVHGRFFNRDADIASNVFIDICFFVKFRWWLDLTFLWY